MLSMDPIVEEEPVPLLLPMLPVELEPVLPLILPVEPEPGVPPILLPDEPLPLCPNTEGGVNAKNPTAKNAGHNLRCCISFVLSYVRSNYIFRYDH